MTEYPEHDKLQAVREQSQACGEFLDWLQSKGISLMRWQDDNGEPPYIDDRCPEKRQRIPLMHSHSTPNPDHRPAGWFQIHTTTQDLLAEFFEIDRDTLEEEKRAMLEAIRS